MRNTKRCIAQFTFYDRTGIQSFLEKQAEKGWLLEKMGTLNWKFRRITPGKIHYAVTYFPKASVFDSEPSEQQKDFQEFCAHTGWKLAGANAQLQIFYNEAENPIPIETDAQMELETIHKSVKKSFIPSYLLLMLLALLQGGLFLGQLLDDPIGTLSANINLFRGFCWVILLLMCLMELVGYICWYRKAKKAAEQDGSFVKTRGFRSIELAMLWAVLIALALLLVSMKNSRLTILMLASILWISLIYLLMFGALALMKRKKFSAATNRTLYIITCVIVSIVMIGILTFGAFRLADTGWFRREPAETYTYKGRTWNVYQDELPLTIEDLMSIDYEEYSYEWHAEESLVLAQFEAMQRPRMDALEQLVLRYTITEVRLSILYDWCKAELLKEFDITHTDEESFGAKELDAATWGADAAYQLWLGEPYPNYLICYDNIIIEIQADWELTPEQMTVIGEKLNGV